MAIFECQNCGAKICAGNIKDFVESKIYCSECKENKWKRYDAPDNKDNREKVSWKNKKGTTGF